MASAQCAGRIGVSLCLQRCLPTVKALLPFAVNAFLQNYLILSKLKWCKKLLPSNGRVKATISIALGFEVGRGPGRTALHRAAEFLFEPETRAQAARS
jgi:hypothetical protein